MKANIEVTNRSEAEAIRAGLENPSMRATMTIIGVLTPLSKKLQKRVLQYVTDHLQDLEEESRVLGAEATTGNGQNDTSRG